MGHREKLLRNGWKKIVVVVVWLEGMPGVYDAESTAKWLGYRRGSERVRRRPEYHRGGLLVVGGIPAAQHRVLCCLHGDGLYVSRRDLASSFAGMGSLQRRALLPVGVTVEHPDPYAAMTWLGAQLKRAGLSDAEAVVQRRLLAMALGRPCGVQPIEEEGRGCV